jgi:hypothetical protein
MNERIKLLAEQAGYTPLPGFDFANELQEVFLEKFAELIVKETLQVARAGIEYGDGMEDAVYKYFGVEL